MNDDDDDDDFRISPWAVCMWAVIIVIVVHNVFFV